MHLLGALSRVLLIAFTDEFGLGFQRLWLCNSKQLFKLGILMGRSNPFRNRSHSFISCFFKALHHICRTDILPV